MSEEMHFLDRIARLERELAEERSKAEKALEYHRAFYAEAATLNKVRTAERDAALARAERAEKALRGLDALWTEMFPHGPGVSGERRLIDEACLDVWRSARAVLSAPLSDAGGAPPDVSSLAAAREAEANVVPREQIPHLVHAAAAERAAERLSRMPAAEGKTDG